MLHRRMRAMPRGARVTSKYACIHARAKESPFAATHLHCPRGWLLMRLLTRASYLPRARAVGGCRANMMKTRLLLSLLLCVGTLHAAAEPQYAAVEQMLEKFIEHEVADQELPALSIALVDDQQIVWSRGFGF